MAEQRFHNEMTGAPAAVQRGNGLAVAGLVMGILALVLCWIPFLNWILAVLGIVFGGVGMSKANKGASGKGLAVAGLVLGLVGFVFGTVIFIYAVAAAKEINHEIQRELSRPANQ